MTCDPAYLSWLREQVGAFVIVFTRSVQAPVTENGMGESFTGHLHRIFDSAIVLLHQDRDGTKRYSSHMFANICSIAEVGISAEDLSPADPQESAPRHEAGCGSCSGHGASEDPSPSGDRDCSIRVATDPGFQG